MTLFLGGPRHGHDVVVPPAPQTLLEIATSRLPTLPPSYVDLQSASTYYLRPVTYVTGHPLTGQPDKTYMQQVYMHEAVGPPEAPALLADAVLRHWFTAEGTLQPDPSPSEQREPVIP